LQNYPQIQLAGQFMLKGKTAIITGAASGFGAEMATAFADAGANVLLADKDVDGARKISDFLRNRGRKTAFLRVDVANATDAQSMVAKALGLFGHLDILVNNAGIVGASTSLEDTPETEFDSIFAVNVKGVFLGSRAAISWFRGQGRGVIINIASGSALRPRPGAVIYSASKGAVTTLTRALALEVARYGIRVNAICPAIAKTPLLKKFLDVEDDAEIWEQLRRDIPLGRLVTPQDVASAAIWLASDAASMITGTCLAVDGGRCA
jgi:3-oxoacyl-[acyl-carrier protein] reductase